MTRGIGAACCPPRAGGAGCGGARTTWTFTDAQSGAPPVAGGLGATALQAHVRRTALEIVSADPVVARLVHGSRLRVVGAQAWSDGRRLHGASLTMLLARPIMVDADLPQADIPPDAPAKGDCRRPYRQIWLHERAGGVTRLSVLVDLGGRAVADVSTNARSGTLSWVPGRPHPSCEELAGG